MKSALRDLERIFAERLTQRLRAVEHDGAAASSEDLDLLELASQIVALRQLLRADGSREGDAAKNLLMTYLRARHCGDDGLAAIASPRVAEDLLAILDLRTPC